MADSTTNLDTIAVQQASKEVTANGLFDAGSMATVYGRRQAACVGLTWAFYGGRIGGVNVENGTVSLAASSINYIVASRSTGAVSVSTNGYDWCDPANYARLYKVTTSTLAAGTYEDHRASGWGCFASHYPESARPVEVLLQQDAATAVTVGTRKAVARARQRMLINSTRAHLATTSSSGDPAVDINVAGLSVFGTVLSVDAGELTSVTAAVPAVLCEGGDLVEDNDEIVLDVDTAGTSATGISAAMLCIPSRTSRYRDVQSLLLQGQGANNGTVFADSSPAARTITSIGGTVTSTAVADPWGGGLSSLLFDGTGDGLSAAYATELDLGGGGDFTVRGFSRLATASGLRVLVDFRGTAAFNTSWVIYADAANLLLAIYNGPTAATILAGATNSLPASGNWFSWQVSKRGATTYVFSDGVLRNSATYTPPATQPSGIRIGIDQAGAQSWHGYMRDVEIIKGVGLQTAAYTPARRAAPAY